MNKRALQIITIIAILLTISLAILELTDLNFLKGNNSKKTNLGVIIITLVCFKIAFYFQAISKKTANSKKNK